MIGKIGFSKTTYVLGTDNGLKAKLILPNPEVEYDKRLVKNVYDHGTTAWTLKHNGKKIGYWQVDLWDADYLTKKEFTFTLIPTNDNVNSTEWEKTTEELLNGKLMNIPAYQIMAVLYKENLAVGNHKFTLSYTSLDSKESPVLAEGTFTVKVTDAGKKALAQKSKARIPKHAQGEWPAFDVTATKSAKNNAPQDWGITVYTARIQTKWKYQRHSVSGRILSRTCKADIVYKSPEGCRVYRGEGFKQNEIGGGKYSSISQNGSPRYNKTLFDYHTYAVPCSKARAVDGK